MNPDHDQQLRSLFRQQREADAQHVPAFSRLLRGSDIPVATGLLVWWRLAVATAAFVVLGVSATMWRQSAQTTAVDAESWAVLSQWQASTDALLTMSATPWGSTMTTPSDSWFKPSTQTQPKETAL